MMTTENTATINAPKRLSKQGTLFGFTVTGVFSIFRKELIQLIRDPYLVMFIIALPLIQLLVTGMAVQRDLKHIPTAVANYDHRNQSAELLKAFESSKLFDLVPLASEDAVISAIRKGKYRLGIVIPKDYSKKAIIPGQSPEINVIIDGTQGTIAKTIAEGANQVIWAFNQRQLKKHLPGNSALGKMSVLSGLVPQVTMMSKVLYNPNMTTAFFLVPAILAIVMHMLTILFTSFAIVRERESGTLEQLMVTPIRTTDLMLGKVLPYACIGFVDMLLTLGMMVWFFNISIEGSFWFLCFASMLFILCSLGIGLLISILCKTQVQAIQLTVAIFLPSLLLTGFVFPLEPMPWFIKAISYCLPLTYYLDIIRGVVIKGIGPSELWLQTSLIFAIGCGMLIASILKFNKQNI
ncbi:MAG: ABC transporter permease [Cyanobacteria bacterium P01_H01_bin.74]